MKILAVVECSSCQATGRIEEGRICRKCLGTGEIRKKIPFDDLIHLIKAEIEPT